MCLTLNVGCIRVICQVDYLRIFCLFGLWMLRSRVIGRRLHCLRLIRSRGLTVTAIWRCVLVIYSRHNLRWIGSKHCYIHVARMRCSDQLSLGEVLPWFPMIFHKYFLGSLASTIALRSGASPLNICFGGPKVRSVPLHATIRWTILSLKIS